MEKAEHYMAFIKYPESWGSMLYYQQCREYQQSSWKNSDKIGWLL